MCTIWGAFTTATSFRRWPLASGSLDAMRHRGPDDQGWHAGPNVLMGFRRLAIIDLSGGRQPLYSEDENLVLTINGEIYNHRELRQRLEPRHRFRTRVDGEVLLHLYEEHGGDFLRDVNGMFAFALYDRRKRRLLLGRDRAGKKPLYYRVSDGEIQWSSEIRGLGFAQRPGINPVALNDYLRFGYVPAPLTLLEGVYKVPAAHLLVFDELGVPVHVPYWQLRYRRDERSAVPDQEAETWQRQLQQQLDAAVHLRLESEVPMGFLLSGGIDSASVFASGAAALGDGQARAFTISFPGEAIDESAAAAEVAMRYEAKHQAVAVSRSNARAMGQIMQSVEEPVSTDALLPTDEVFQAVRRAGITVVLAGEGADEVFAGYRKFRSAGKAAPGATPLQQYLQAEEFVFPGRGERMELMVQPAEDRPFGRLEAEVAELDPLGQMLALENALRLPDRINLRLDKLSMAHSIEARAPFMDHHLRQFAAGVPRALLLGEDTEKAVLRRAMAKRLPHCIISARKAPFHAPDRWLTESEDAREVLGRAFVDQAGMVRHEAVAELAQRAANDRGAAERLYSLYVLHLWHRDFYQRLAQ